MKDIASIEAEKFVELPGAVGNITFTPDAQVIFSQHPFFSPDVRVAQLNPERKSYTPFPNERWNTPYEGSDHYLDSVLGIRSDENGIVLNYEWLYFGPASGSWVYRIRLDDLVDETLSNGALAKKVEKYAQKPNNGGLSIDEAGNLYLKHCSVLYLSLQTVSA